MTESTHIETPKNKRGTRPVPGTAIPAAPAAAQAVAQPETQKPQPVALFTEEAWKRYEDNVAGVASAFSPESLESHIHFLRRSLTVQDMAILADIDRDIPTGTVCLLCKQELSGRATRAAIVAKDGDLKVNDNDEIVYRGQFYVKLNPSTRQFDVLGFCRREVLDPKVKESIARMPRTRDDGSVGYYPPMSYAQAVAKATALNERSRLREEGAVEALAVYTTKPERFNAGHGRRNDRGRTDAKASTPRGERRRLTRGDFDPNAD